MSPSEASLAAAPAAPPLPWWQRAAAAYVRREWPGWGRVYAAIGGNDGARWLHAGTHVVRGKLHGYRMELDLANWSERLTWFLGRYHDLSLQRALQLVLRPGDAFVDIGANLGMLSLLARHLVGPKGAVLACEPNPRLVGRVERTLRQNRLDGVEVLGLAVSDAPGSARLFEYAGHAGWGSLSPDGPPGAPRTASWTVPCRTGDELLAQREPARPLVVKIDVEGHEVAVLRGLDRTLATRRPLVFCEVVDAHLRRAGASAAALQRELLRHGYRGFELADRRRGLGHDVAFRALDPAETREVDAMFVPPGGPLADRVAPLLPCNRAAL